MSANGRLSSSELTAVDGVYLANVTAKAWKAMVIAAAEDGITLNIVKPAGGYRSFFVQGDMKKRPWLYNLSTSSVVAIAAPGYSTHGRGISVDISSFSGARREWVLEHARDFGFSRPFGERDPNHFLHDGRSVKPPVIIPAETGTPVPLPEKEDFDMSDITFYKNGPRDEFYMTDGKVSITVVKGAVSELRRVQAYPADGNIDDYPVIGPVGQEAVDRFRKARNKRDSTVIADAQLIIADRAK